MKNIIKNKIAVKNPGESFKSKILNKMCSIEFIKPQIRIANPKYKYFELFFKNIINPANSKMKKNELFISQCS